MYSSPPLPIKCRGGGPGGQQVAKPLIAANGAAEQFSKFLCKCYFALFCAQSIFYGRPPILGRMKTSIIGRTGHAAYSLLTIERASALKHETAKRRSRSRSIAPALYSRELH